jgi:hypothetical protein
MGVGSELSHESREKGITRRMSVKEEARKIIDGLPDGATWEEIIYRLCVREAIEAGIADADAGRVVDIAEVRADYGLQA